MNIERQVLNILAVYPNAHIVREAFAGTTIDRKEWNKVFKAVTSGDTIIFVSVSRMSRNAEEGFATYEELYHQGIELVFLKEPHINTATFKNAMEIAIPMTGTSVDYILEGVNKYLMTLAKEQIRLAFEQNEKEVMDLRQRTKEGIQTAKLNGKIPGRKHGAQITTKKSIAAKEVIKKYAKDFGGSLPDKDVMILTGLARNTYYKYKRELKAALEEV